jgi:hypothetical protein
MSRIEDYVQTLSPAERERFAGLIEECRAREAGIAASSARAQAALGGLDERQQEFAESVRALQRVTADLRDSMTRLFLVTVPPKGRVS